MGGIMFVRDRALVLEAPEVRAQEVRAQMTPRQRVWAALRGEPVDRPPISFWGHFYHRESSAEALVDATLEFHGRYRWDWVKLNPRKHYHVEPWGVRYHYPGVPDQKPTLSEWPIHSGDDWSRIGVRPHDE